MIVQLPSSAVPPNSFPGGPAAPSPATDLPASAFRRARTAFLTWWARLRQSEERVFLVLAVIIGALTGLAVVAFILVTERFGMRLYPVGGAPWRRLLFPVTGSLGIGYLLYRYFPDARGSGVPQTKAALFAREGRITMRTVLGKFFCTSATLASGIPLGREGPSVQVGAGLGSVLGRALGLRPEQIKKLIPVGAAAAIAAAFNTPLAAVVFSLEEIMGDMHAPVMGAVVLASATAWMVLRVSLGDHPLFHVPQYQLVSPWEFAIYGALGVAGGVVSATFTRMLLGMRAAFLRLPRNTAWFQPVVGGLLVGLLGWFVPQVLGVGLRLCRPGPQRHHGIQAHAAAHCAQAFRRDHQLRLGKRRRHLRPRAFSRCHGRRSGRHRRTPFLSRFHCTTRRVCAGRHGRRLRGNRPRPHDFRSHDL